MDKTLREAILSLHHNLPLMEEHMANLCDLREKLVIKELELNQTISQTKTVLSLVKEQLLGGVVRQEEGLEVCLLDFFTQSDHVNDNGENGSGEEEMKTQLPKTGDELRQTVADLTIKISKDSLTKKQRAVKETLTSLRQEQDSVCGEIVDTERDVKVLESIIEESKEQFEGLERERLSIFERKVSLEKELEKLALKYCEMNEALLAQSVEESNLILQSIREDLTTKQGQALPSPLLQKYVGVAIDLTRTECEMKELCERMSELGVEDCKHKVLDLREKLRCHREAIGALVTNEDKMLKFQGNLQECESQSQGLDATAQGDLVAAMKWGQLESGGLYQPSVSSAPVVLLLFQQYCRQRISFHRSPKKAELCDSMTADRLRRCGCSAIDLKLAGYAGGELRAGGYSIEAVHEAGYSLMEMATSGVSAAGLRLLGYQLLELKACGIPANEMRLAGVSLDEIQRLGYSLEEMKDSGISVSEFRSLGCTIEQLRMVGFTAGEVRKGGVSLPDLQRSGYSPLELQSVGIYSLR
jgi:ribosomal protein L13E